MTMRCTYNENRTVHGGFLTVKGWDTVLHSFSTAILVEAILVLLDLDNGDNDSLLLLLLLLCPLRRLEGVGDRLLRLLPGVRIGVRRADTVSPSASSSVGEFCRRRASACFFDHSITGKEVYVLHGQAGELPLPPRVEKVEAHAKKISEAAQMKISGHLHLKSYKSKSLAPSGDKCQEKNTDKCSVFKKLTLKRRPRDARFFQAHTTSKMHHVAQIIRVPRQKRQCRSDENMFGWRDTEGDIKIKESPRQFLEGQEDVSPLSQLSLFFTVKEFLKIQVNSGYLFPLHQASRRPPHSSSLLLPKIVKRGKGEHTETEKLKFNQLARHEVGSSI
ncbi:hypothetical protein SADUNF_Sadunf19G0013300 [Salix dunnii]|uniref:Uncharacterized protein n=1 Tax=Salix dunnii TaxID=1413687 RepID=A0A835J0T6_9ROSI|nr:hypothetical protein SADUNF_Sadunf19G0013300 [Salix dunnii]